jgi:hypothetical protein
MVDEVGVPQYSIPIFKLVVGPGTVVRGPVTDIGTTDIVWLTVGGVLSAPF